jgi:hypothetical protein
VVVISVADAVADALKGADAGVVSEVAGNPHVWPAQVILGLTN